MKTLTKTITFLFVMFNLLMGASFAEEQVTVDEVYEKVLEGVQVMEQLGIEGLEAFNGTEFAWKDTFLSVVDCEKKQVVATLNEKVRGASTDKVKCVKTGRLMINESCEGTSESGLWIEYWFQVPKTQDTKRRLTFLVPVSGMPYMVAGSIWDENISAEELNKSLK